MGFSLIPNKAYRQQRVHLADARVGNTHSKIVIKRSNGMRKQLFVILIFLTCNAYSDEGVDIVNDAQINALLAIQDQIDAISAGVMSCMDKGKTHPECLCENETRFVKFKQLVENLLRDFPELANHDIVRFKAPDGMYINQSLEGIRNQANVEITCDK